MRWRRRLALMKQRLAWHCRRRQERVADGEISGRTRQNKVVVAAAPLGSDPGTVRRVRIEQATAWQLKGQALN